MRNCLALRALFDKFVQHAICKTLTGRPTFLLMRSERLFLVGCYAPGPCADGETVPHDFSPFFKELSIMSRFTDSFRI